MTDAVITEHTESRHGPVVRYYQYGNGGVRVLDAKKSLKRMYRFDTADAIMTECDPTRPDRTLRRFVFDNYGMNEETYAFGARPRSFRYEAGGERIVVREGGDYGAVGKLFTFEENGISETGWGRNGEIERVFSFDAGDKTITERSGGWFGAIERVIVLDGIRASVFREPEAFLQFLVFTEWSEGDREAHIDAEVARIRKASASPYAYTGPRAGSGGGAAPAPSRARARSSDDSGIDFIADADSPAPAAPRGPYSRRGDGASVGERRQQRDQDVQGRYSSIKSDEIALQDRFEQARSGKGELSKGWSVDVPVSDRFEYARQSREPLSKGRSVEIPLDERFGRERDERDPLPRGASVDIPLEERFEASRRTREKPGRGRSAEIPYDERRGSRDR